ncbi:MAG: hypothetical protein JJ864_06185 [Rhizobiaceae bacterium]|nr:hypothetical protein [Rhizobiaceae bacterium]
MTGASVNARVALFTGQDVGFQLVEGMANRGDIDLFVVTNRTARDDSYGYRSAVDPCIARQIPLRETSRVDATTIEQLASFSPDLIISAYYPHIIPLAARKLSRIRPVNVHPGLLPAYRGKFPTPWYILNGATEFGLSIHRLDGGIDTGPVLVQRQYPIDPEETGHSLYRKTMDCAVTLILEHLDDLLADRLKDRPQVGVGTYYDSIERRFPINWNMSARDIERRVRVHAKPYFPAFTFVMNHLVSINRVRMFTPEEYTAQGGGKIIAVYDDGRFVVSCCDGCVMVEDYEVCPSLPRGPVIRLLRLAGSCTS